MWTCPECSRRFGRTNQGHECLPVVPLEDWLAAEEDWVAAVCSAAADVVDGLGDDHVIEAAEIGLLVKRRSTVLWVLPRRRWVDIGFTLGHRLDSDRISRLQSDKRGARHHHVVRATVPDDLDDELVAWMTEAYLAAEPAN